MDCKRITSPVERIDEADTTFAVSIGRDREALGRSIALVGLMHPPFVRQKPDGRLQVVSGFARAAICKEQGWSQIPVNLLPENGDMEACACIAVADNSGQRPLNTMEQARAVALLERFCAPEKLEAFLPLVFGRPSPISFAKKIAALVQLPPSLHLPLALGKISLPVAQRLCQVQRDEARAIGSLLADLPLSVSKQKEIFDHIEQIAAREETTAADVLDEPDFRQILQGSQSDANVTANLVRAWLKMRRFPNLEKAMQDFDKALAGLGLPPSISWQAPPFLEGTVHRLALRFENRADIENLRDILDQIISNPALCRLLDE
ncbi:MAG: ParB N-terminal domain-containing protein [Desulfatibacillaceae bacterium]|nr:ParB N-terminal domain-containing protein [Desulfatibacillaceae bacterium]